MVLRCEYRIRDKCALILTSRHGKRGKREQPVRVCGARFATPTSGLSIILVRIGFARVCANHPVCWYVSSVSATFVQDLEPAIGLSIIHVPVIHSYARISWAPWYPQQNSMPSVRAPLNGGGRCCLHFEHNHPIALFESNSRLTIVIVTLPSWRNVRVQSTHRGSRHKLAGTNRDRCWCNIVAGFF
jgi:hypothetical protein